MVPKPPSVPRPAAALKRAAPEPADADADDGGASGDSGAGHRRAPPPKRPRGHGGPTASSSNSAVSESSNGSGGDVDEEPVAVIYEWLDSGHFHAATGRHRHGGIRLTVEGASFVVRVGDAVRLNDGGTINDGDGTGADSDGWVCRVEELWKADDDEENGAVLFRGRWFLGRDDLARPRDDGATWTGPLTWAELVQSLCPGERVLSNSEEDNDIGSIIGVARVVYHDPREPPPTRVPAGSFLCRYKLDIDDDNCWRLAPWDEAPEAAGKDDGQTEERTETNDTLGNEDEEDDSSSASSSSSSGQSSTLSDQVRIDGEGSNLRSDIQIGPKYQVTVPPFVPGTKYVPRRHPRRVWTADAISEKDLTLFMDQLAAVQNAYLEKHGMSTLDGPPYSPLPAGKAEKMMRELDVERLCSSHMSTASGLTSKRNKLLKECDVDAILELLHQHDYNVDTALKAAKSNLAKLTTGWTKTEKVIFNDGYRQEQGSIRDIAKLFQPMKTDKDVIDYWYRFKMADQFRLYLDRKRDQAIRIMECIEKRRYHECTLNNGGHRLLATDRLGSKASHWSETGIADATSALEDRRSAAKALLLDVNERMGGQVTAEIAAVIRRLHENYDARLKKHLFTLLAGHSELQQRFLEFLPKS